jgi:RND family efflux transporter MFP subunit
LQKAEEKLADAEKRLQRSRELREKDLIATDDLRAAEAGAAAASAERDLAQAQLARQEAELAQLRQLLALADIVTPVAGLVARRWVEPGAQIQSSGPVLTIAASGSAKIIVRIPGKYLSSVHQGLAAEVRLKDLPGRALQGRVVNVYSDTINGDDAAAAEIGLADFEEAWVPGMEASVTLRLDGRRVALLVPKPALVQSAAQAFVHGIVNGNVQRRPVTTGETQAEMIEITSGLSEGEWVIVDAAGTLEPGRRVRVLESGKGFR